MANNISRKIYITSILFWAIFSSAEEDVLTASKRGSIRVHKIAQGKTINSYNPPNVFETYGSGLDPSIFSARAASNNSYTSVKNAATSFLTKKLALNTSSLIYKSGYSTEQGHYAYYHLSYNNIPVANSVANVAFNQDGKIISFGSSFIDTDFSGISPKPSIDIQSVIPVIEKLLNGTYNRQPPLLEYYVLSNGSGALTYVFEVINIGFAKWYEAFVDAHTGELVGLTDFVASASYYAVDIKKHSVDEGQTSFMRSDDPNASPLGWLNNGTFKFSITSGNNGQVFKPTTTNEYTSANPFPFSTVVDPSDNITFTYPFSPLTPPDAPQAPVVPFPHNLDAARTNGFYIVNKMHDMAYRYGFTEDAFNFQVTNIRGSGTGKGGDPVMLSVQPSGLGNNNAWFATPGDGSPGRCYMLLWTFTVPERDGALANDILVHELTHGITNRMTGGGTGRCLQDPESLGLGEGWSDAMADFTELKSADVQDYTIGSYVFNNAAGVRTYPYSTSSNVNPLRYSSLQNRTEPHAIGEVWANMLHNLLAALVVAHGWSGTAATNPGGSEGNIVFLHLFMDALALQPCNPSFIQARNAIIQADRMRYGGRNRCLIWNVFASRGLGLNADGDFHDNTDIPLSCKS